MSDESSKLAVRYLQRIDERLVRLERLVGDLIARLDSILDHLDSISDRLARLSDELAWINRHLGSPDER